MGHQAEIVAALRTRLLAAGVPTVVIGPIRGDVDRVISLTPFPVDDELTTGVSYQGVKVLIRLPVSGGANPALDDQDTIYDSITTLSYTDLGGHIIAGATRDRSAPLGLDANGRYQVTDTYYLITNR